MEATSALAFDDEPDAWKPETVDVEIEEEYGDMVIRQEVSWGDGTPLAKPDYFGMEFDVSMNFDTGTLLKNPYCASGYESNFVVDLTDELIYVDVPAMDSSDMLLTDPYVDTRIDDSCDRMAASFGMRYPDQLLADNGEYSMTIEFWGERGNAAENRIDAGVTLVNEYACWTWYPLVMTLAECMGLNLTEPDPSAGNPRLVLAQDRGWYAAPELCLSSGGYGAASSPPEIECGIQRPNGGVPVSYVAEVEGDALSGWDVELTHDASEIEWDEFPYYQYMPALNPTEPANLGPTVVDVHLWRDNHDIPTNNAVWEFEVDPVEGTVTLRTEGLMAPGYDDESILAFFRSGSITFREGRNGPVNSMTLENLQHQWNPELVDPMACAVDWTLPTGAESDETYSVWYGTEECGFIISSSISSGSTLGSSPFYEYDEGFLMYDFWIGDQKEWVWAPANGTEVTVSYYRPLEEDYVEFFSEPANFPGTYLVTEPVEYPAFEEEELLFEVEVRRSMWTQSDYFGPEDEGCLGATSQLTECERYDDYFRFDILTPDVGGAWGDGWALLSQNGGMVSFTSVQNESIEIVLGPGNYMAGEIGYGGDT